MSNKKSLKLAEKKRPPGEDIVDILIREKRDVDSKIEKQRLAKERQALKELTFKPYSFTSKTWIPRNKTEINFNRQIIQ